MKILNCILNIIEIVKFLEQKNDLQRASRTEYCYPLQIHMLRPNRPYDGVWRWDL